MPKRKSASKTNFLSNIRLKSLLLPLSVVAVVILLGFLKNQFVAAKVNGEQINRLELVRELEKKEGQRALENLISQRLIMQEAEKRKVNVSDEDVNLEVAEIEKNVKDQGQNLDDLLSLQGLTRKQLGEEVRMQLILRKLAGKVEVTDKEVDDYIEQNKEAIPQDANMEEIKTQVRAQLEQDKTNQKIQSLMDKLRKEAKIEYLLKF
jgi:parvulin-like peptidyl-prolyl isomerase